MGEDTDDVSAAEAELGMELALVCEELLKLGLFQTQDELSSTVIPTLLLHLNPPQRVDKGQGDAGADAPSSLGKHSILTKLVVCRMLDYICDLRLRVRERESLRARTRARARARERERKREASCACGCVCPNCSLSARLCYYARLH